MSRIVLTTHPQKPERIAVRFPYQPDINERLKDHGGRWDPDGRTWHIPQTSLAIVVRAFHPDAYGDPSEATAINVAYDRIRDREQRGA